MMTLKAVSSSVWCTWLVMALWVKCCSNVMSCLICAGYGSVMFGHSCNSWFFTLALFWVVQSFCGVVVFVNLRVWTLIIYWKL